VLLLVTCGLLAGVTAAGGAEVKGELGWLAWPAITREAKPWVRWWWMGSAVDPSNLTRELTEFRQAGFGGVELCPLYGVKGEESRYLYYLSPRWMEMLAHTTTEAQRLSLGVDFTTGTGWPFGGPQVTLEMASSRVVMKTYAVAGGTKFTGKVPPRKAREAMPQETNSDGVFPHADAPGVLQCLIAFSEKGECLDLTEKVDATGGLDWTAPAGQWQLYAVGRVGPIQKVKRAAPGGEGCALDPFSPAAMRTYLERFNAAFADFRAPVPRAQFHDSFEYFAADWTQELFSEFAKRRGYDLRTQLPALFGQGPEDTVARVKSDYRETMSELHLGYLRHWTDWAHGKGSLTRNQAHGSPGNLLDHYAAADIPETEAYHRDRSLLVAKFASSAAHVTGKPLVSSETGTWVREHFTETLADLKTLVDEFFVAGVNHAGFHGAAYSPDRAPWPGWLFYAPTQCNARNPIWRDLPALTAYVTRCQSVLQSGRPDNQVLLYWPVYDLWHKPAGTLTRCTVHYREWLEEEPVGKTAEQLWQRGFSFDYISDSLLDAAKASGDNIELPGTAYRVLVAPPCEHMPLKTLAKFLALAEAGATVIFTDHLPRDVPGLADLESRRAELQTLLARVEKGDRSILCEAPSGPFRQNGPVPFFHRLYDGPPSPSVSQTPPVSTASEGHRTDLKTPSEGVRAARIGKGVVLVGGLEAALATAGIQREPMTDNGMLFIRRATADGHDYFIVNRADKPFDGWLPLSAIAKSAILLDPMNGQTGIAALRQRAGRTEVFVQMQPGESRIVRLAESVAKGARWPYHRIAGDTVPIVGKWRVEFLADGPVLPPSFETDQLGSWTAQGGEAERFAGTALYRIEFDAPAKPASDWLLDLGGAAQSARVRFNGKGLGTLFTRPFRVSVGPLQPRGNVLEIEVTSVAANRIRDLDRRRVTWRIFHDINFVSFGGRKFDASNWPLTDAGLLGPVTLQVAEHHEGVTTNDTNCTNE